MNQSSFIAGFLLAGFVIWLAANNRLTPYEAVLWGTPQAPNTATTSTGGSTATGSSTPATVAQTATSTVATGVANPAAGATSALTSGVSAGENIVSTVSGWTSALGGLFGL